MNRKSALKKKRIAVWFGIGITIFCLLGACACFFFTSPKLRLNGSAEERIALNSVYSDQGVEATVFGKKLSRKFNISGTVDTAKRGSYPITYSLKYHGRQYAISRTVTVADFTPPEITLNGEKTVTVSLKSLYREPGVTATDNLDGDLSAKIMTREKTVTADGYTLEYRVTDSDGNTATAQRQVIIKDIVPPVISIAGGDYITLVQGTDYREAGASATDDVDGDVSSRMLISGTIDPAKLGKQTVTYTAQDQNGNTATVVRTVTVISKEESEASKVFLTFDDGPSAKVTPRILDILKKNNVRATFFILNYSEADKPIIQRMLNEGHTIGIHGYTHDYKTAYASVDAYIRNIEKLQEKLHADFGYRATLIRFLGGSSNTVSRKYCPGVMTKLVREVTVRGYSYFDWNISSGDAEGNHIEKSVIADSVKKGLRHGRNNVILMHDATAKTTTADALQEIIDFAKVNAYQIEALSDATPPVHHPVQN